MIFKDELCDKVLSGDKTQTRRLKRENEYFTHGFHRQPDSVTRRSATTLDVRKWVVGRTYAVQPGRGKKAVGRIKLLAIREEQLQNISDDDCYEEGIDPYIMAVEHATFGAIGPSDEFRTLWDSINKKPGTRWEDNPTVWVLTFQRA